MSRVPLKDGQIILSQAISICKRQKCTQRLGWSLVPRRLRHEASKPPPETAPQKPTSLESKLKDDSLKESLLSIPGPSWLWTQVQPLTYPFRAYGRAQQKHPYRVQILSSLVIYFLGDLSSQLIQRNSIQSPPVETKSSPALHVYKTDHTKSVETDDAKQEGFQYDRDRSLRALIIGGLFSLPSYHWFMFLSRNFNVASTIPYSMVLSLAAKVTVNQIVFAPLFSSYFFGMQSLLSNSSSSAASKLALDPISPVNMTVRKHLEVRAQAAWCRVKETVPIAWYNSCKFWPLVTAFSFTFVPPQSRSVFAGIVAIGWQSYLGIVNERAVAKAKLSAGAS